MLRWSARCATTRGTGDMADDDARPTLHNWLLSLAETHGVKVHPSLEFRETTHCGRGLFAVADIAVGEVLLAVPNALTLSVQDGAGVSLPPDGNWRRTRAGVTAGSPDHGKGWECVLSRAVLDAVSGDGGGFWEMYGGLMPPPEAMALPFLIPTEDLGYLEDALLAEDAVLTRSMIAAAMPDLLDRVGVVDEDEDGSARENKTQDLSSTNTKPDVARSAAAWALALVRSRVMLAGSVRGGGTARAIVPFMDLANHASIPNADYRCDGIETKKSGVGKQTNKKHFELVCVRPVKRDSEINLAYTKGEGTSREHFNQYGFVPGGGYARDRVELGPWIDEDEKEKQSAIEGKTAVRLLQATRLRLKQKLQALTSPETAFACTSTETKGSTSHASWVAAGSFLSGLFGAHKAGAPMTDNEEQMTLTALRNRIAELEKTWRQSLAEDEDEAVVVAARVHERRAKTATRGLEDSNDERTMNVLSLRLNKKRLVNRVKELLAEADLDVIDV